ncbi:MAG: glutathione S-transferase [Rhizobiaceae bacterium]
MMKLWYAPASPFVRKVVITCDEAGLSDQIELHRVDTNVIDSDEELRRHNPVGKIPTLVLDDGAVLYDSRVICAYLDELNPGNKLIPAESGPKFRAMTLEALADGIMDAAVNSRYETALRPKEYRWEGWVAGQFQKIETGLDSLEANHGSDLNGPLSIGVIAVGCALGYLEFRFDDFDWSKGRPGLSAWYEEFKTRPSMINTIP